MIKNLLQTAEEARIDKDYELDAESVTELLDHYYSKPFDLVMVAFHAGYVEGTKATKRGRR